MTTSIKKMLLDTLFALSMPSSGSASNIEPLEKKITELSEENEKLKKLYLRANVDIAAIQSVIKTIAYNQAQLVADMHTIYTAVKDSGIMDAEYSDVESNMKAETDDDDTGGSDGGGMGGMLN